MVLHALRRMQRIRANLAAKVDLLLLTGQAFHLGLVLDAAIIVQENIVRLRQNGMPAAQAAHGLRHSSISRMRLRRVAFRGVFHSPELVRPELLWEFLQHAVEAPGFLPAIRGMAGYDFLDRLEKIQVPTLIVWGRNDHVVPATDAPVYNRLIPGSALQVYNRTGHVAMAERPVRFNRELERFLTASAS